MLYLIYNDAAHKTRFLAHVARLNGALRVLYCVSPVAVGVVYTFFIRVSTVRSSNPSPSPPLQTFCRSQNGERGLQKKCGA